MTHEVDTPADAIAPVPPAPRQVEITITLPESEAAPFQRMLERYWYSELYRQAEAAREADEAGWVESLRRLFAIAEGQDTGSARVIASVLAGCYNGHRFPMDLTDLRLLDADRFEQVLNVLRLDNAPKKEVHCYFDNGGQRFEAMIEKFGLEQDT